MLSTKEDLQRYIKTEKENLLSSRDKKGRTKINLTNDHLQKILKYMKYMRYEGYHRNNSGVFHKVFEMYYARKKNNLGNTLGFYMSSNSFDEGLTIYHHGSVIVNGCAKIGKNCKLHGNNCIGNKGNDLSAPTIGDNVDIGFGAVIIGNVYIADNVKIGANAVVTKSCYKKGAVLVGVPAVIRGQ